MGISEVFISMSRTAFSFTSDFHCHVSRATQIKKKEGKMDAFLFRVCLIALFLVFNCNF